jgi:hypothetical protein
MLAVEKISWMSIAGSRNGQQGTCPGTVALSDVFARAPQISSVDRATTPWECLQGSGKRGGPGPRGLQTGSTRDHLAQPDRWLGCDFLAVNVRCPVDGSKASEKRCTLPMLAGTRQGREGPGYGCAFGAEDGSAIDGGARVGTPGRPPSRQRCVSTGIQHNNPGQHRLGAGTACRAGAQVCDLGHSMTSIEIATVLRGADRKHRLVWRCACRRGCVRHFANSCGQPGRFAGMRQCRRDLAGKVDDV